jgi:hypothetical protein
MEETENRKEAALEFSEKNFGIPQPTPEERAEQKKRYGESAITVLNARLKRLSA